MAPLGIGSRSGRGGGLLAASEVAQSLGRRSFGYVDACILVGRLGKTAHESHGLQRIFSLSGARLCAGQSKGIAQIVRKEGSQSAVDLDCRGKVVGQFSTAAFDGKLLLARQVVRKAK